MLQCDKGYYSYPWQRCWYDKGPSEQIDNIL